MTSRFENAHAARAKARVSGQIIDLVRGTPAEGHPYTAVVSGGLGAQHRVRGHPYCGPGGLRDRYHYAERSCTVCRHYGTSLGTYRRVNGVFVVNGGVVKSFKPLRNPI